MRKANGGVNFSVVMMRVAPNNVPQINVITPVIQYSWLKHNKTSSDCMSSNVVELANNAVCDKQTPVQMR